VFQRTVFGKSVAVVCFPTIQKASQLNFFYSDANHFSGKFALKFEIPRKCNNAMNALKAKRRLVATFQKAVD
jgi:hypothetical protein